ncbi:hypothetical protein M9H77_30843 [Catharanthus roseus]|uniref:Uncharacterized protein n=1 Tax=Catharanthus roseus TaxID=4058 RepID=A0ACC0A2B0_CATRO|nr:hypothetical protein M9H77_30843 [Catharanthus roseus]
MGCYGGRPIVLQTKSLNLAGGTWAVYYDEHPALPEKLEHGPNPRMATTSGKLLTGSKKNPHARFQLVGVGYNHGAYGGNHCGDRSKSERSINVFYVNESYGNESMVGRGASLCKNDEEGETSKGKGVEIEKNERRVEKVSIERKERVKENEKLEEETYFLGSIATMLEVCEKVENLERKVESEELENTSAELKCEVSLVLNESLNSLHSEDSFSFTHTNHCISSIVLVDQNFGASNKENELDQGKVEDRRIKEKIIICDNKGNIDEWFPFMVHKCFEKYFLQCDVNPQFDCILNPSPSQDHLLVEELLLKIL